MLSNMPKEAEVEIKNALKKGDLQVLKSFSKQIKDNPHYKYRTGNGILGNAIQFFCVETNPGPPGFFFMAPPYYKGEDLEFRISQNDTNEIINFLIEQNVAIEGEPAKDGFFKQLPLGTAIGFDNTHAALALIEIMKKNGKVELLNEVTKGTFTGTPLILAIQKGNKEVFNALLATEMMILDQPDEHGLTPLHWAVIMGLPDMVEKLVQSGANIDAVAKNGRKPIDYLSISKKDFEPTVREVVVDGQKVQVASANSSKLPEFRAIVAHFNNDEDSFLKLREEKLKSGKQQILPFLLSRNNNNEKKHNVVDEERKNLIFKKEKNNGKNALLGLLLQNNDLELAMQLSRNVAEQREQTQKQILKEKDNLQYDMKAEVPDAEKLYGSIGAILQHIKLSDEEEKELKNIEDEKVRYSIQIDLYAQKVAEGYGYPLEIAKILTKRVVFGVELKDKDIAEIKNIHLQSREQAQAEGKKKGLST
ncbi:MAG: hypothetical protein BGO43_05355 [Gammaproteobacteria bacterium 39-13]|nr:ankyrin repeat domain-containing protein [Gammaproteobacteria bacterium]OJV96267.1 MAG: hypothetical protein BGO43_05355 [Gammaproteobacteria bacterium 39-13]